MQRFVRSWTSIFVVTLCWFASVSARSLPDVIDEIRLSVVGVGTIEPTRRPPVQLRATGFVVADGRHIITNAHAVPTSLNATRKEVLAVFAGRGKKSKAMEVSLVGRDMVHDLALLRLNSGRLPAVRFGDSAAVREGESMAFTGFPIGAVLGLYPSTHQGIVSAVTPLAIPQLSSSLLDSAMVKRLRDPYDVFQLDATAYPGNSGSPLYNPQTGEVIGIINKVFVKESRENLLSKPSGITFAIPARYARELMSRYGLQQ